MKTKSLAVALMLGIGLLIVIGPKLVPQSQAAAGLGNCYSDSRSYSTPTLCE
jgi:hypothetical protein